jgi:hypothetical protein
LLRQLRKWHKYKMASKVARPAAQLQELFKFHNGPTSPRASLSKDRCKDTKFAGGKGSLKIFQSLWAWIATVWIAQYIHYIFVYLYRI